MHVMYAVYTTPTTITPQLPFKPPQIPSDRDHKALDRSTLGPQSGPYYILTVYQIQNRGP